MDAVYERRPLRLNDHKNIRLIELVLPNTDDGVNDSLLECKLHVVSLEEESAYVALSYTWGVPEATGEIMLDGEVVTIRKNLWDFLHEARRRRFVGFIFVDALSIDQANFQERNHQVALMARIYLGAKWVIVWQGDSSPSIKLTTTQ